MTNATQRRITVLTPTYNRASYLGDAIASVLAQDYADFRLVVGDNASDDGTSEVVAELSDPRVEYVRHPENIGYLRNFNFLVDQVGSDYFTVLPDDDQMLPGRLRRAVELLDREPRVGLLHSSFSRIDGEGRVVREVQDWIGGVDHDLIQPGHEFIRDRIGSPGGICFPTAVYRTEAAPFPVFDPGDDPSVDLGLFLRIALEWDVAFIAEPLVAFRDHEGSDSARSGWFSEAGYVEGFGITERFKQVKLRFLFGQGRHLPDHAKLVESAERTFRRQMLDTTAASLAERRTLPRTVRLLREAAARDPRVLLEPGTGRMVVGSAVKPALRRVRSWSRRRSQG